MTATKTTSFAQDAITAYQRENRERLIQDTALFMNELTSEYNLVLPKDFWGLTYEVDGFTFTFLEEEVTGIAWVCDTCQETRHSVSMSLVGIGRDIVEPCQGRCPKTWIKWDLRDYDLADPMSKSETPDA